MITVRLAGRLALSLGLVSLAACSGSAPNRAGVPVQAPSTLTMVGLRAEDQQEFADAVEQRSNGSLRVELQNCETSVDCESTTVDDVKAGHVTLGDVGARAWHALGNTAFDALNAPLLIDSFDLQTKVLQSPLMDEMAAGLEKDGLVAVGVLPGPMRQLLGLSRPLTKPADFAGERIGFSPSWVAEQTFASLAATGVPSAFEGTSLDGMDAIEQQIDSIANNGYGATGQSFTENVVLWPRPIVVFMRKDAFEKLPADAQAALRGAVGDSLVALTAHRAAEASDAAVRLCRAGVRFVDASPDDVAALRSAVQPVYDTMNQDPVTKRAIEAIQALKSEATDSSPAIDCPDASPSPPAWVATPIEGTWQACDTRDELLAAIRDPKRGDGALESDADEPANYGCVTVRLDHGAFSASSAPTDFVPPQPAGTYTVNGNTVTIVTSSGELFDFTWSVFKDTLTFGQVTGKTSPTPWVVKAFKRAGD